ncbi:MAG: carbon monoxide dehydrogenase [Nitrospira sp.]|nr:MAG: carbon monoxide dehydrogenase [Nitrospira sp.]
MSQHEMTVGPEGYLAAPVSSRGVVLPSKGEGLVLGKIVPEQQAIDEAARRLLNAQNPTIFPGPLVLWSWNEQATQEAKVVKALAKAIPAKLIPMPDYRPKYPKIFPYKEINPNHPNLTIWQNKIDVCLFVGVHCHQSNIALKIIRGGTSCFTIALCTFNGDDEAHITIRDLTAATIQRITDSVERLKRQKLS